MEDLIKAVTPVGIPTAERIKGKIIASGFEIDHEKESDGIYKFRFKFNLKDTDLLYVQIKHEWIILINRDVNEVSDHQELGFLFSGLIWQSFISLNNITPIGYPIGESSIQKYVFAVLIANRN